MVRFGSEWRSQSRALQGGLAQSKVAIDLQRGTIQYGVWGHSVFACRLQSLAVQLPIVIAGQSEVGGSIQSTNPLKWCGHKVSL